MFEKKCHKCGNVKQFESDIKQWTCPDCGANNPQKSVIAVVITFIAVYLLIRFLFWVM